MSGVYDTVELKDILPPKRLTKKQQQIIDNLEKERLAAEEAQRRYEANRVLLEKKEAELARRRESERLRRERKKEQRKIDKDAGVTLTNPELERKPIPMGEQLPVTVKNPVSGKKSTKPKRATPEQPLIKIERPTPPPHKAPENSSLAKIQEDYHNDDDDDEDDEDKEDDDEDNDEDQDEEEEDDGDETLSDLDPQNSRIKTPPPLPPPILDLQKTPASEPFHTSQSKKSRAPPIADLPPKKRHRRTKTIDIAEEPPKWIIPFMASMKDILDSKSTEKKKDILAIPPQEVYTPKRPPIWSTSTIINPDGVGVDPIKKEKLSKTIFGSRRPIS